MKLSLGEIPMVGKSGERDNVQTLIQVLSALVPSGTVVIAEVKHDDECPCSSGELAISHCICKSVNVTLDTVKEKNIQ